MKKTAIKFLLVIVSFSLLSCNRSALTDDKDEKTYKSELFSMKKANALDKELTEAFDEFRGNWESYESTYMKAQAFQSKLRHALINEPKTIFYPFEKLSEKISIAQSDCKQIRFYSWNNMSGGSWQKMTTFVQFLNETGEVVFKQLSSDEKRDNDEYIDAVIYEVHKVNIFNTRVHRPPRKLHFVTFGSGSQGGGTHFNVIQIFRIDRDDLLFCRTCFDGENYYLHRTHRLNEIKLEFMHPDIHIKEIRRESRSLSYSAVLELNVDRYSLSRRY